MKKNRLMWLLAAIIILQLSLPIYTIVKEEKNLSNGISIRLKVLPVDPHDPFRGKFLNLRFDNSLIVDSIDDSIEIYYLTFKQDTTGIWTLDSAQKDEPGGYFLRTKLLSVDDDDKITTAYFNIPFNRYYTNELLVKEYERIVNEALNDSIDIVTASIKLGRGNATLEELYIGNTPLPQYAAEKGVTKASHN